MFRSLPNHHQRVRAFLVKVTELNCEHSCVVMRQHNIQVIYVMFGVVKCAVYVPSGQIHVPHAVNICSLELLMMGIRVPEKC
jgi:hypothetical protein